MRSGPCLPGSLARSLPSWQVEHSRVRIGRTLVPGLALPRPWPGLVPWSRPSWPGPRPSWAPGLLAGLVLCLVSPVLGLSWAWQLPPCWPGLVPALVGWWLPWWLPCQVPRLVRRLVAVRPRRPIPPPRGVYASQYISMYRHVAFFTPPTFSRLFILWS